MKGGGGVEDGADELGWRALVVRAGGLEEHALEVAADVFDDV